MCHSDEQRGAEGLNVGSLRKGDVKIPRFARNDIFPAKRGTAAKFSGASETQG